MRFVVKYLLLMVLLYQPKVVFGASYFNEPASDETYENPYQAESCFNSTYTPFPNLPAYEQEMVFVLFDEDDFADDGGTEEPEDGYNGVPIGDALLPLCIFVAAYGLWKRRKKTITDRLPFLSFIF